MTNIYFTRAIQPENDHPHFLAKALIVDATGKILVLERSNTHPLFPHCADLPGGIVEPGETPLEAARREIEEETGLSFAPSQLSVAFEHVLPHPDGQRLSYMCYAALVDGNAPLPSVGSTVATNGSHQMSLCSSLSRLRLTIPLRRLCTISAHCGTMPSRNDLNCCN